jgi:3-oxoacyl-[acyl-carrier protein] reductase
MDETILQRFSLEGRDAVVVGAASGIGRAAAIAFARAGARLTLADRDRTGLGETLIEVRRWDVSARVHEVDVRDPAALDALGEAAGAVDVWANVAGVIAAFEVTEADPAALDRILDVNLKGTYWGCATAARLMKPRGRGSIINISSAGADIPGPGLSAYAMSKAAVNMLTRTLAHEVGGSGVRVNAVAPGFIDTPMVSYRYRDDAGEIDLRRREEIFASRASGAALKRIGAPEEIALAMLYLASDASAFVTGQVLRPNGGTSML